MDDFKVEDKRRFTREGEPREETGNSPAEKKEEIQELPPIDFTTFVLSLASSVQVHLGLVANPTSNLIEKNLQMAKQTIDILGLLEEKTKGNLREEESRVLEHVLYDLRMRYLEASR